MQVRTAPVVMIRPTPLVEFPREPLPAGVLWATARMRRECEAERLAFSPHPMRGALPCIPRHRGRFCLRCGQIVIMGTTLEAVLAELEVPLHWYVCYQRIHEIEGWLSVLPEELVHIAATGDGGNTGKLVVVQR